MNNVECFQQKLDVIKAIPEDSLKTLYMPVKVYIQEAEDLHAWSQPDKDVLIGNGLSWELVDDIPIRCGVLKEAESLWSVERNTQEEAEKLWAVQGPQAYELRDDLVHEFRFAYRNDEKLSAKVGTISGGTGHADMLQDLNDLAKLGKAYPEPLTKINFDMTILDEAAQKSFDLASLLATANGERADYSEAKRIRDQAFTYLKQAVDELYAHGQFAFADNKARLKCYRSKFMRQRARKPQTPDATPTPPPVPTASVSFIPQTSPEPAAPQEPAINTNK
ncbi:MAG: hypothetical protein MUF15_08835 [Acidobacteria bacterium]|jgi:hypothetical protein|nr:hypothetical protein [Acidobacteriota bacterium]